MGPSIYFETTMSLETNRDAKISKNIYFDAFIKREGKAFNSNFGSASYLVIPVLTISATG